MGEAVRPPAAPSRAAPRGRLLVLSGPSGVGKTVVAERLLLDPRFGRAVTATTRPPRPGEQDGVDYHFLSVEEFRRRLAAGWFLEHAEVYGRLYGTPVASVEDLRASGRHCLLVIDVQGAATLRRQGVDALFVFLDPPSLDELARRLAGRDGADSPAFLKRMAAAATELAAAPTFDCRVVNLEIGDTARKVAACAGVTLQ